MIDIEREREAFESWHYEQYLLENPNIDIANAKYIYDYSHKNAFVRLLIEAQFVVWQAAKAQAIRSEKCVWRNVQNELWYSECGEEHLLDQEFYETITEHLTYCFKCGKKIEEDFGESGDD